MIFRVFRISFRSILRDKAFSAINIGGLTLGLTCSILIALWVWDEVTIDQFHRDGDHIYSVYARVLSDGKVMAGHYTPGPLAEELPKLFPEIEYSVGFDPNYIAGVFEVNEKSVRLAGNYAGPDFFKLFSYPIIEGSKETAISEIDGIAISRKMSEMIFGSPEAAIGKTIRFNHQRELLVTAVFENISTRSSDQFDFLLNWRVMFQQIDWVSSWLYNRPRVYLKLHDGTDPSAFAGKLQHVLDNYNREQTADFKAELGLQRFDEKYLWSAFRDGYPVGGRIEYVRLFSVVAVFVLLIACINFMNLSTARSMKRAKEIGVKKVVGAARRSLVFQFVGEAMVITFFSILISISLIALVLPWFNELTQKHIAMPFFDGFFWITVSGLLLITSLLAGSYPAFYLSSLNAARVLKGSMKFSLPSILFRKGLVVFQFVIAIAMIVGTIAVSRQISFLQETSLGFEKSNLIYIPFEGDLAQQYHVFKQEALGIPGVMDITRMSRPPERIADHGYDLLWEGRDPSARTNIIHAAVGYDFTKTLHIEMKEGRDYSENFTTDSTAYIINETALKFIGYKDPINKPLSLFGRPGKIIGVMKDFHFNTLRQPIEPLIIRYGENIDWGFAVIRLEPGKVTEALADLEQLNKKLNPVYPFNFSFCDEQYNSMYRSEQTVAKLANGFAGLAIFISSLGLLGLVMLVAQNKAKEIGIRKVLGASVSGIMSMLSKEFILLIIISMLIAFPLSWLAIDTWLQSFAYRAPVGWTVFLLAGLSTLVIALATMSFHSARAAMADPVKSLKNN